MDRANTPAASEPTLPDAGTERTRLLFATIALFLLASGICSFFIFASIDKFYSHAILDQYFFLGQQTREQILRHLCSSGGPDYRTGCAAVGQPGNDGQVARLLDELSFRASKLGAKGYGFLENAHIGPPDISASLLTREGRVLADSDGGLRDRIDFAVSNLKPASGRARYFFQEGVYLVFLPIRDGAGDTVADLIMQIPEEVMKASTGELLERHEQVIFMVLLAGVGMLTLALGMTIPIKLNSEKLPVKRTSAILLTLVCGVQIASFVGASVVFRENYQPLHEERTRSLAEALRSHIEGRLGDGTPIHQLATAAPYDRETMSRASGSGGEFDGPFSILDISGQTLLTAHFQDFSLAPIGVEDAALQPDGEHSDFPARNLLLNLKKGGETVGFLSVPLDKGPISQKLVSLGIEVLIAVVISLLCLVEFLLLVFRYLEKRIKRRAPQVRIHYGVMRPVIFLFLFGIDLSAALIPLQMERLYEPILGLPKDLVLGLPVSAMFLMVGVTFIIAGAWMDRRGWHEPFVIGVLLTGISKFCAWLATDALQFVTAMAGIGFGYGLALMAAQGFVMANTSENEKAHGISYFFAGVYAGSIGGTAIGAMLAERLGYDLVFLAGSLFIFVCLACGVFFLRPTFVRPEPKAHQADGGRSGVLSFLLNRNVLTLILFCSIPSAVAVIGFLNYFSPVYLSRLGVSESIIGGVLTLYGISMVYVSPIIGAKIDRTERKDVFIVAGCVLGGCAFLGFNVLTGLPATILAIILLGLSMSCLQASQTTYTLRLKATKRFGDGKAVAIVRASSRVGQMLGPMVFSGLVIAEDTERAMTIFGLGYLILAILFMALSRREHPDVITEGEERVLAAPGEAKV